jgi:hypothetical protein
MSTGSEHEYHLKVESRYYDIDKPFQQIENTFKDIYGRYAKNEIVEVRIAEVLWDHLVTKSSSDFLQNINPASSIPELEMGRLGTAFGIPICSEAILKKELRQIMVLPEYNYLVFYRDFDILGNAQQTSTVDLLSLAQQIAQP